MAEENALLRRNNGALAGELEQMNRVASYVGSRVARVLAGARRANNANAALVGELKRWNRKLEVRGVGAIGWPVLALVLGGVWTGSRASKAASWRCAGAGFSCFGAAC